jgi:hypothetical protein
MSEPNERDQGMGQVNVRELLAERDALKARVSQLEAAHAEADRLKDMYRDDAGVALRRASEIVEAVRRYAAAEISASKLAEVCGLDVAETARGLNDSAARADRDRLIVERDEWKAKAEALAGMGDRVMIREAAVSAAVWQYAQGRISAAKLAETCRLPVDKVSAGLNDSAARAEAEVEWLKHQIDPLADAILEEFGGPALDESACEAAVRIMRSLKPAAHALEVIEREGGVLFPGESLWATKRTILQRVADYEKRKAEAQ